jgi:probable F420-dependent oxidoreductase
MQNTYDPFTVLTFVAAQTEKVQLGTSVLVASYRSPLVVGKMGATLDVISGGRLILGIGAGWNSDEFTASGQSLDDRHEQADEFLLVLKELWTADQPEFTGKYFRVPPSIFLPKPLQKPHPPIWIGGNSKRAIRRAAELGDGWHPTSRLGASTLAKEMKYIRNSAANAGRHPEGITLSVRWNASPSLTGGFVVDDVVRTLDNYRESGVEHVCFDLNLPQPSSVAEMQKTMRRLALEVIPRI